MKLDNLITYIFLIMIGVGLIILAIHTKNVQKKTGNYSLNNSNSILGGVLTGIIFILFGLIKILSL